MLTFGLEVKKKFGELVLVEPDVVVAGIHCHRGLAILGFVNDQVLLTHGEFLLVNQHHVNSNYYESTRKAVKEIKS
ncbi:MAG: hypothetical protein JXR25_05930 [Pontiellaceae bacterium]|nr:hypothetical protein [Pontiellaceae bacterium]MBN2784347.1 hypothetical protein [Pontiellaceae bacterium]